MEKYIGKNPLKRSLIVGIVFLFLSTTCIPVFASEGKPEITRLDTVLEIEDVRAGIGKITAEIKNVGEQPANNVSWVISLVPKSGVGIPGWGYFEGVIPTINPQETSLIESSDFLIGFGFYDLTISAECDSSHLIETGYTVFIFLFFIFIFK